MKALETKQDGAKTPKNYYSYRISHEHLKFLIRISTRQISWLEICRLNTTKEIHSKEECISHDKKLFFNFKEKQTSSFISDVDMVVKNQLNNSTPLCKLRFSGERRTTLTTLRENTQKSSTSFWKLRGEFVSYRRQGSWEYPLGTQRETRVTWKGFKGAWEKRGPAGTGVGWRALGRAVGTGPGVPSGDTLRTAARARRPCPARARSL